MPKATAGAERRSHSAVYESAPLPKGKGGTEELHSRTGNDAPGRPCQLAALSGRRAAQDGRHGILGGPERADAKFSGEALSAGRVAAPDQLPGEGLGRGHSAARVARASAERAKPAALVDPVEARPCERAGLGLFQAMARAVVVLGLLVGPAAATEIFLKPGDTGKLEYPIQNIAATGTNRRLEEVRLTVIVPQDYQQYLSIGAVTIKEGAGITQPLTIEPGQTRTFVIPYQLAENAPDGAPQVQLHVEQLNIYAEPASLDTSVIGRRGFARAFDADAFIAR